MDRVRFLTFHSWIDQHEDRCERDADYWEIRDGKPVFTQSLMVLLANKWFCVKGLEISPKTDTFIYFIMLVKHTQNCTRNILKLQESEK